MAPAQDCTTESDEFTGTRKVVCESESATVEDQPSEHIYNATVMAAHTEETGYVLILTVVSESWNFLGIESAYGLLDNHRREFTVGHVNSEINGGRAGEQLAFVLGQTDARRIAEAGTFRVKIRGGVFDFGPVTGQMQYLLRKTGGS
jgi:hypothetical protein